MAEEIFISPENLGDFFKKALCDKKNIFVFSTDVVMNSWIDWCVTNPEKSGLDALPLERFIAWDKFKGQALRAKEDDKGTIPAILKKFFVSSLIRKNAESPDDNPLFKKIINPKYKKEASSFTDWISRLLPSLNLWKKTLDSHPEYQMDLEDKDYLELYKRYSDFLSKNNLYEPAWIEPDFTSEGKHYIIFYPQLLEDYAEYKMIFDQSPEITIVSLDKKKSAAEKTACTRYSDSRKELRRTILRMRKLSKKTGWDKITLNVPDLQTYRPYLERELTRYCVPFVIRAGYQLIQNSAGQIFSEIQKCAKSDFSYDSVRALVLDEYIPWKEELKDVRLHLIQEGNSMRCICGFEESLSEGTKVHFDSWEEALKATSSRNERELAFYRSLKKHINALCNSNSFEAISQAWIIFKKEYLEEEGFSESADAIIGRCITELKALIQIENDWCRGENSELAVSNHYDFFISELSKKTYTPQNKKSGLSVYPYKTSAGAAFFHQFVIDASQKNLEVQYKKLPFLNSDKRRLLRLEDDDKNFNPSEAFIRLYDSVNDNENVYFSFAEESFSGYAICHNALKEVLPEDEELDREDFILNEKNYMRGNDDFAAEGRKLQLSSEQKKSFLNWQLLNAGETEEKYTLPAAVKDKIREVLIEKREKDSGRSEKDGKIVITQSDMKNFFPCHRRWIFSNIIKLQEDSLDADLMQTYDMGNINHKILELFMKDYINPPKALPVSQENVFEDEEEILSRVKKYAALAISNSEEDYSRSPLTQKMLISQLDEIASHIMNFLHIFLQKNTLPEKTTKSTKTKGFGGYFVRGVELQLSGKNPDKDFNYFGKLDLLLSPSEKDSDSEGWTIIDYKNTKMPAAKNIRPDDEGKLKDFQMPMYVSLIQKNKADKAVDAAKFYSIKDGTSITAIDRFTSGMSMEDFEAAMKTFEEYSASFSEDLTRGCLEPHENSVDIYKDCPECNFKSICRYNYEVAGRKISK